MDVPKRAPSSRLLRVALRESPEDMDDSPTITLYHFCEPTDLPKTLCARIIALDTPQFATSFLLQILKVRQTGGATGPTHIVPGKDRLIETQQQRTHCGSIMLRHMKPSIKPCEEKRCI